MHGDDQQLRIKLDRPDDVADALRFFRYTAYDAERLDERTLLLSAPGELGATLARREVEIYVRILQRLRPDVGAIRMD
jgi:hypothetical protein